MARFAYEQGEAKLVHVVLLLYLYIVVSMHCTRTLTIGSCKSKKRAAKLHLAVQQQPFIVLWT